eukprot:EG_transcript_17665
MRRLPPLARAVARCPRSGLVPSTAAVWAAAAGRRGQGGGPPRIVQRDRRGTAVQQMVYEVRRDAFLPQRTSALAPLTAALREPRAFLWQSALLHLLPRGYPDSVVGNYLGYVSWHGLQSVSGCAGGVLAMQALLGAVGVGSTGAALPLAATLNWVLKDGLGQVGGIVYAAVMKDFDSKPKSTNFYGILNLELACLLEVLTFLVPALFLPLAGLANIGKSVACISLSATRAAIHQSFTNHDNLADITAKAVSQAILASMLGTALGCLLLTAIGAEFYRLLGLYLGLCAIQLYSTYRCLELVSFRVFNAARLTMVLDALWLDGRLLRPEDVGPAERFVLPVADVDRVNPVLHDTSVA